jgi:hypothetical protein
VIREYSIVGSGRTTEGKSKKEIRLSEDTDPVRAEFIAKLERRRPKSNWREVLESFPEGGRRAEVR